jgi:hypothetical protein
MAPAVLVKLGPEAAWKSRYLAFCRSVTARARHAGGAARAGRGRPATVGLGLGLTQAMKTLKALQSETSDFPVNLPALDLGQPVLNLAIEGDQ